jgi:hypothetical protein
MIKVAADAAVTHSEMANRANEALIKAISTLMSNPNMVGGNIEKMNKTLVNTSLTIYKIKVSTPEGMLRVFFTMIPPDPNDPLSYPTFIKLVVCKKQDEEKVYKEIGSGKRSGKSMAGLT